MYLYEKQQDIISVYEVVPNKEKIKAFKKKEVPNNNTKFYKFDSSLFSEFMDKIFIFSSFSDMTYIKNITDRDECIRNRALWLLDLTAYEPLAIKMINRFSKDSISTYYFQILSDLKDGYGNSELTLINITKKLYLLQTILCKGLNNINLLLTCEDISMGELYEVLYCFDFNFLFDIKEQDLDRLNDINKISNYQEIIDSINLLSKSGKSLARTKSPNGK